MTDAWKDARVNKSDDIHDQLEDFDSKEVWKIGLRYYNGEDGISQDESLAFHIFKYNAIENDHFLSMMELGCMCFVGSGTKKSYRSALNWWNRLEEMVPEACYGMGVIYYNGSKDEGVDMDHDKALYYWKKGASLNDTNSIESLDTFFPTWHQKSKKAPSPTYTASPLTSSSTTTNNSSSTETSSLSPFPEMSGKNVATPVNVKEFNSSSGAKFLSKQFSAPVLDIESISGNSHHVIVPSKEDFSSMLTPRSHLRQAGRFRLDIENPSPSSAATSLPSSSSPSSPSSLNRSLSYLKDRVLDIQVSLDALAEHSLQSKALSIQDMQQISQLYTLLNGTSMSVCLEELRLTQLSINDKFAEDALDLQQLQETAMDHADNIAMVQTLIDGVQSKLNLFLDQQQLINSFIQESLPSSLPLIKRRT